MELNDKITLVVTPGTQLNADVTSGESKHGCCDREGRKWKYSPISLFETPTILNKTIFASITANGQTAYFQTLADAVKTVQDGQTITLLKNSDVEGTITISRVVTFTLDQNLYHEGHHCRRQRFNPHSGGNTYTVSVYVPPVTPPDRPSGDSSDNERTYAIITEDNGHGLRDGQRGRGPPPAPASPSP